jgi:hypothetical protein
VAQPVVVGYEEIDSGAGGARQVNGVGWTDRSPRMAAYRDEVSSSNGITATAG